MRGSSTLCSAVARGSRLKVWNTNPISLLRMRASASSSRSETFWALSQYSPDVGVSRQPIRFMSVDLPDPDGPMTATYSFFKLTRAYDMGGEVVRARELVRQDDDVGQRRIAGA